MSTGAWPSWATAVIRSPGLIRPLAAAAGGVLAWPWFARHVVLDRWFLHREATLAA